MTYHSITGTHALARRVPATHPRSGPYGWLTPYIAAIAAHDAGFDARVLDLRRTELHFIALCLSLMGDKRDDADHLAAFARGLNTLTRKTLVMSAARLGGVETIPALAKLPPRLAGGSWRAPSYARLAQLMNEPAARKTLAHLARITRRQVTILGRLPADYRTPGVLKMIRRPGELGETLFAIEIVRRIRTDLDDRQIIASLEKTESRYIREWVMRHYEHAPFPAVPVEALIVDGVEALRPLASYADLARAAREFDNCIRDYLWRVLKGDAYFYRYAPEAGGKGVAIVELRRAPVIGWVVHEMYGPHNDPVASINRVRILAAFRGAGISAAPQAMNPNVWFELN